FPRYVASVPAVRWSILSGLLWSLSPAASLLGSLKAWRSLSFYVLVILVARWVFPWAMAQVYEPLDGVARGSALAAAVVGVVWAWRVHRARRAGGEEVVAGRAGRSRRPAPSRPGRGRCRGRPGRPRPAPRSRPSPDSADCASRRSWSSSSSASPAC